MIIYSGEEKDLYESTCVYGMNWFYDNHLRLQREDFFDKLLELSPEKMTDELRKLDYFPEFLVRLREDGFVKGIEVAFYVKSIFPN